MLPSFAVSLAALLAALYLVWFCFRPSSLLKTCVKTASVLLLVVAAALVNAPVALIVALALCAIGDFFLSLEGERSFLAGVAAFAAGHIAYIVLFISHPASDSAGVPVWAIAVLFLFAAIMMALLYRHAGSLRFAVLAYVLVIAGMGVAAMSVPSSGALWLALPAALMFMASDTVLATEMFLLRSDHPLRKVTPFIVWALYWLAQLGFLLAFAPL
ncbi:lysoplasmalogenase [Roseovarius sp. 2305UL8-3]|uniref:lysoplasmalogenase n=1 Tax=Roseovarius conchicola TaxID=3121636 RepID=UPI003528F352